MYLKVLLAAIVATTIGSGAFAQFSSNSDGGQQPTTGAFGQQDSFSNVTTSFDGLNVQIRRLIQDPDGGGAIRLVFQLGNGGDKDRRMLFVGPRTTLIDELGNVFIASETVGVEHCEYNRDWYPEAPWCAQQFGNIATRLAPGVPVTVAIKFQPAEGYSEELAGLSQTVSLRSRLAHYADDLSDPKTADIIVNDIPFPR